MRDKIKQMEKVRRERSTEPADDEEEEAGGVLTLTNCLWMQQDVLCACQGLTKDQHVCDASTLKL